MNDLCDPRMNTFERWLMDSWPRRLSQLWELQVMRKMGLSLKGKYVLEMGCGTGWLARRLSPEAKLYLGVDLDHAAIRKAHSPLRTHGPRFSQGDCAGLDLWCNFDVILSFGLLHHVPDWRKVVDEAFRILRPGGELFLVDFTHQGMSRWWHRTFFHGPPPGHFYPVGLLEHAANHGGVCEVWPRLRGDVVFLKAIKA